MGDSLDGELDLNELDDGVGHDMDPRRWSESIGSGLLDAAFNFTNSIVGAGGPPYALLQAGFITGLFLLIALAWLVDQTVLLLVLDAKLSGQSTYQGLIAYCYGKRGLLIVSLFQFIFAYGAMCAYTVIIGDTLPTVFSQLLSPGSIVYSVLTSRQAMIALCTLGVSLPLSLYRDISALAKTSAVSLGMILFIVLAVIVSALRLPIESKGDPKQVWSFLHGGIFQAIGVISFAFVCHHNTFLIYGSLRKPTMDRFAIVTHLSTGASLLLCLAMAVGGYVAFSEKTRANVLSNFAADDTLMNWARLFFGMNMFLTFPLECFVCREVLFNYWWSDTVNPNEDMSQKATPLQHVVVTLLLVISSMAIALSTCDLGFVLEITGGFAATMLAYILPAACFLQLSAGPLLSWKKAGPLLCIAFGVAVMVLSTALSVSALIDSRKAGAPPRTC
ncbi:transmembrane amino acid transporter protein-domain-containing protein [Entophlyctis helioformis]|nr:transmembrane amino acid transporter protein-domain-containing protein [Entophlyctis helioformis]